MIELSDALFALQTLVEYVNALDKLPLHLHRNDWTAEECLLAAREYREYCTKEIKQ